jgi:hypothetical protein
MSLNGLDASAVNEAYQLALVESGGWYDTNNAVLGAVTMLIILTGSF